MVSETHESRKKHVEFKQAPRSSINTVYLLKTNKKVFPPYKRDQKRNISKNRLLKHCSKALNTDQTRHKKEQEARIRSAAVGAGATVAMASSLRVNSI